MRSGTLKSGMQWTSFSGDELAFLAAIGRRDVLLNKACSECGELIGEHGLDWGCPAPMSAWLAGGRGGGDDV